MTTRTNWVDVSYRHKEGVWETNIHTGEEREVKAKEPAPEQLPELPLPIPDLVVTVSDEVVEHAKKPRQFIPKTKGWKNNAA